MKKKKISVLLCAVLIVSFFTCVIINWHIKDKLVNETSYQQDDESNKISETEIEKVEYDENGIVIKQENGTDSK